MRYNLDFVRPKRINKKYGFAVRCVHDNSQRAELDKPADKPRKTLIIGKVIYKNSDRPVAGASVVVKGTAIETVTDISGSFSIEVPPQAKYLEFSFYKLKKQDIRVSVKQGKTTNIGTIQLSRKLL